MAALALVSDQADREVIEFDHGVRAYEPTAAGGYLDPQRRTPRCRPWSLRHREEQESYCRRFVTPALAALECRRMTRGDFERTLDAARTRSTADHLRRCLTALVRAGIEDGYLLARQDVLRAVHCGATH